MWKLLQNYSRTSLRDKCVMNNPAFRTKTLSYKSKLRQMYRIGMMMIILAMESTLLQAMVAIKLICGLFVEKPAE